MIDFPQPIVSSQWLNKNIVGPNIIVVDATILKAIDSVNSDSKNKVYVKGARVLDIKNDFSNVNAPFPNTMLSSQLFEEKARNLGINNDSIIIVYDDYGYYSSSRVWWMFKAMGHQSVSVLDGGLPVWRENNFPVQKYPLDNYEIGAFKSNYNSKMIHNYEKVLNSIDDNSIQIIDARSNDRYLGVKDEPRPGLRSGHIPNSKSLPYTDILDGYIMKKPVDLKEIFKQFHDKEIIFSCGSGITACILALGAEMSGLDNISIYDGSWTEWGSMKELPIEK